MLKIGFIGALAAAGTVALVGCASSGQSGTPVPVEDFSAKLSAGMQNLSSAHMEMDMDAGPVSMTATGDETMTHGELDGMDMQMQIPSTGDMRIRLVGDKIYAQLPASIAPSEKPWTLLDPASSNPQIAQFASSMSSIKSQTSAEQFKVFADAAKQISDQGAETVDGAQVTKYKITVDVSKVPTEESNLAAMESAGIDTLPLYVYLDQQNRPVKLTLDLSVQGQKVHMTMAMSKFNEPTTIAAPPAADVDSD